MNTVDRLCAEAELIFDPTRHARENFARLDRIHQVAVTLKYFVRDMDEGGFRLHLEREPHGKRRLGIVFARVNCKATQMIIQALNKAIERSRQENPNYTDLDDIYREMRNDFCEAAEKAVNKCPGCDAKSLDGPHRFSCYARGARQVCLPVVKVGEKFVVDTSSPLAQAQIELLKRGS